MAVEADEPHDLIAQSVPADVVAVGATLLAALPIAAALVLDEADGPRLLAGNDAFAAIRHSTPSADAMLRPDQPIGRAARALLAEDRCDSMRTLRWNDGDAVSGRHYTVTLSRMDRPLGVRVCFVSLIDRTAEVESARSLRAELSHDSLTGLPNRAFFAEAVEDIVAGGGHYAVLLVDLARFSRVNESLGVMAGDETIITVARRLLSTLRRGDLLARVGGNEFGVLVKINDRAEALVSAERIRSVLAAPFRLSRFEIGLECAVGCALSGASESGEELVRHAQLALKRAKATGRVEVHSSGEAAGARYRLDIETELRRAIESDQLSLAFQPIVHLARDRMTGFEALARWTHAERGIIEPSEFIPVAEETGLIVPLGRWALDRALATLARWDEAAGRPLAVAMSVNVSAIQLSRDDVPTLIAGLLAKHGLAGERLTVELTESAIVQDPERTSRALNALKALNVRIAMDDFGTGYSSLAYLRRLPIDILKIDRSFVSGMLADRDKVAIVRAVLSLADALGKHTTAEGVETVELSQTLAALGCTHGQGYLYAAPLEPDDAFAYLVSRA
ncbi:putative bifunctional diguanylate cyclase/phosphodiesterase [Sphingomonas sp.]|uniref:putative bifunctional diguanylate cyclase/phosphodiesterase n=1 Tax=Sphingomonas sp. TaxID=28214 RepID=UPI003AFF7CE4